MSSPVKYPEIYTLNEVRRALDAVLGTVSDVVVFLQPKYDGSNVTCFMGRCYTRNLSPLPGNYEEGLRKALGDAYEQLMRASHRYQIFLELGGHKNCPAGWCDTWSGDWDYVVFDAYDHEQGAFLQPPAVETICRQFGLRYVGHRIATLRAVLENIDEVLREYGRYEGVVVKAYPPDSILALVETTLRHHRDKQRNTLMFKLKHDTKPRKTRGEEKRDERPPLPLSELMGAINKAHLELGDEICDRAKAMKVVARYVREEAEKHGFAVPSGGEIYRAYLEYVAKVCT